MGVHSVLRAETCGGAMRAFRAPATIAPRARVRGAGGGRYRPKLLSRASSTSSSGSSDDDALEAKRRYVNVTGFPFPLTPLLSRATVSRELVPDRVWVFEQEQGIGLNLGVSTNVRMTVVRMRDGRLWIHDPIAPTEECLELLAAVGGDVAYVVLATTQYEHKVFCGPFARRFPNARMWVAPGQFSFPVQLPNQFFGIFPAGVLDDNGANAPWRDEIDQRLLRLPPLFWNQYTYCEAAFHHRDTGTVLVTDAAVYVSECPPEIIPRDALVDLGAEDGFTIRLLRLGNYRGGRNLPGAGGDRAVDPDACAAIGWRRMALFSLFIAPDAKNILAPEESFAGLANRFAVSPIVFEVVFQFYRDEVAAWARDVAAWKDAERVVSAHFPAYEGKDAAEKFAKAFEWAAAPNRIPAEYANREDLASLELVVRLLRFLKAVPPE